MDGPAGAGVGFLKGQLQGHLGGCAGTRLTCEPSQEVVKVIAKVLGRPLFLPRIPESLLKTGLGEMSALVLESQHVSSLKVERSGYNFKYHQLEPALDDLLKA